MTRWLLIVAAVLAWVFGLMLLFDARAFEAPVGIDVTDKVATIAQAQGATLVGLGVTNWLARNLTDAAGLRAVLGGNLVVQVMSLGVAARAVLLHIFPIQGAPAIAIHVLVGAAFTVALVRAARSSDAGRSPRAA